MVHAQGQHEDAKAQEMADEVTEAGRAKSGSLLPEELLDVGQD